MRWPAIVIAAAVVLLACGKKRAEPKPAPHIPAPSSPDCGDVRFGNHVEDWCPDDRVAKFECFTAAKKECRPSRLGVVNLTEEGGKIKDDYRIDASCKMTWRHDNTGDGWAKSNGVTLLACRALAVVPAGPKCTEIRALECEAE